MKRAFVIHGWSGTPDEAWFPWIAGELRSRGFEVTVPAMPETDAPAIEAWVGHLRSVVGTPDEETFLIGHSIGCQTILRYLESLDGKKIGGAVFVAGFFALRGLESEEEEAIAAPWTQTPIDLERVKRAAEGRMVAILSDEDRFVALADNLEPFEEGLGAEIVMEYGRGHLGGSDDVMELPSALDAVLRLAGMK